MVKAKIPLTRYVEAACVIYYQTKREIQVNEWEQFLMFGMQYTICLGLGMW